LITSTRKYYPNECGFTPEFLARMYYFQLRRESQFQSYASSGAGAVGPCQFIEKTARDYGVNDRHDYRQCIPGMARMMKDLIQKYDCKLDYALAGYNWGSGNIAKYGFEQQPSETRVYIQDVLGPAYGYT
ncbi:MAG: lytic transglycosylase domain-containing protein, partial [Candidatus Micrarchaeota archaeon]